MPPGTIGTDTQIDRLLADYYPSTPNSILYEIFESETAMLVGALLMEQRGTTAGHSSSGANYHSETVTLAPGEEEKVDFEIVAKSVLLYDYSEPIEVALKSEKFDNRALPLDPSANQKPADFSPDGGLGTEHAWVRNVGSSETDVQVVGWG